MKVNQIKAGVILSYLQMALQMVIGLIYTPVMLRLLGQSEYGLYNTVASTISTLGILSLGFGSSYVRYYSKYKEEGNECEIRKLNGLFMIIFSFIGAIAAACGLFLSLHMELVFDQGLTSSELSKAKILMLLLTFNLAMSFPMSVFSSIIGAHERFVFSKLISMIQTVLSPCLTLPLLLLGYGSIGMVLISVFLAAVSWILNVYYCIRKLKVRFVFRCLDVKLFQSLFSYSFFIAINIIVDQINWNIDKILLGRFQGTSAVAVYSVGFSLYTYYQNFSTSVSNVFIPRVHTIVNSTTENFIEQKRKLTDLFIRVGRIQYLILILIASGIVFFGKDFILKIWAGLGYKDSYYVALLLIIPASVALIQNLGIEIQRAENLHQFRSVVYVIMAIVNLGLSIILCQRYGAIGSAIGTAIALILANGLIMNIFYHKKCNINIVQFWREILHLTSGLIIPIVFGIFVNKMIPYTNTIVFVLKIVSYSLVYIGSMWMFGMNNYEKELLKRLINRVAGRVKI